MPAANSGFGIVEVLGRGGRVVQRMEVDQNVLTIGRAYDNDIILDDNYVCPKHVSVMIQGGSLIVNDHDSVNGISQNKYYFKGGKLKLSSNETFKIGHTTIRYRAANTPLNPTKIDRHIRNSFWSLQNPMLITLACFVLLGFIVQEALFTQTEETDKIKIMADSMPAAMTVIAWAGFWSLFGKLMIDKLSFFTHLGIFSVANVGFYLISIILGYAFYAFGLDSFYSTIFTILVACVVLWMLFTHMGYSTKMPPRSMLAVSVLLTMIGTGFYLLQSHVLQSEFNYLPSYEVILKSPDYNYVSGDSLENFFADADTLKELIKEN